jgi:hypothetical protein
LVKIDRKRRLAEPSLSDFDDQWSPFVDVGAATMKQPIKPTVYVKHCRSKLQPPVTTIVLD